MSILKAGGIELPSPTSISVSDEIIWSSDTGRTLAGLMVGDIVAEKKNISIRWDYLGEDDLMKIRNNLRPGFFSLTIHDDGADITMEGYRSAISKEQLGDIGDGVVRYRSVTVDVIQR